MQQNENQQSGKEKKELSLELDIVSWSKSLSSRRILRILNQTSFCLTRYLNIISFTILVFIAYVTLQFCIYASAFLLFVGIQCMYAQTCTDPIIQTITEMNEKKAQRVRKCKQVTLRSNYLYTIIQYPYLVFVYVLQVSDIQELFLIS